MKVGFIGLGKLGQDAASVLAEKHEVTGYDINTKKKIMGIGLTSCIANQTKSTLKWEIPDYLTLQEAATIPVVYLTSAYSLFKKANLEKGMTVLIHAGTGGIGHSAIHLCQQKGIKVLATCSIKKQEYLSKTFNIPKKFIANSRDTSFVEMVLRETEGKGVDCVLNSLSKDCLHSSLEIIKDFGCFCEIGKFDLQNNTKIGLKSLERNISYHAIDLAEMFNNKVYGNMLQNLLQDLLDSKMVKPLPYKTYQASETKEALRFLSSGKHKGKVLIKMDNFSPKTLLPKYQANGSHLITGGLGGFGLELAYWLLKNGANKIFVTSRSGIKTGWQKYRYNSIVHDFGIDSITISNLNVIKENECQELINLENKWRGIWHVAMVLSDRLFTNMDQNSWDTINKIKVNGVQNLNKFSLTNNVDNFIVFSSIVSLTGNMGQTNYARANQYCEKIIEERIQKNNHGVAIQWGAIDNVGHFNDDEKSSNELSIPIKLQNIDDSLNFIHNIDNLSGVVSCYLEKKNENDVKIEKITIKHLQNIVSDVLGGDIEDYDVKEPLQNYGLDSLSTIEIINWINNYTSKKITPSYITSETSIKNLFDYIQNNLKKK